MTTHTIESGVAFAHETSADVSVEATFIDSGEQLQHIFVGLEPILIIQPEYDADDDSAKFIITAVDLPPQGLVSVLEVLLDSAKQMVKQDLERLAEIEAVSASETPS